jgi:hypothetical protein
LHEMKINKFQTCAKHLTIKDLHKVYAYELLSLASQIYLVERIMSAKNENISINLQR